MGLAPSGGDRKRERVKPLFGPKSAPRNPIPRLSEDCPKCGTLAFPACLGCDERQELVRVDNLTKCLACGLESLCPCEADLPGLNDPDPDEGEGVAV